MTDINSSTRGILHAAAGRSQFSLSRFEAGSALQPFVEHFWAIRYDRNEQPPYTQTVLSYPNVNLAFEQDEEGRRALLYGIPRRPFQRTLSGSGKVLGIKFRAGGFFPFWQQDVSKLTGMTMAASSLFGPDINHWINVILDAADDAAMAELAEKALSAWLPERNDQAELATQIVNETMVDRNMTKVDQMCERYGLSIRQLQRLFSRYVGITPKWVIKRFRLQEAAELLERDQPEQWAELAAQLGYFDQAHFIKDFKSVLGQTPAAYRRMLGSSRN
jgi:AraC-like DNA-binding protein